MVVFKRSTAIISDRDQSPGTPNEKNGKTELRKIVKLCLLPALVTYPKMRKLVNVEARTCT